MRKYRCLMPSILLILSLFQTKITNAQDWANLKEFEEANTILGAPKKGENRVVFMGNSITIGWSARVPEFFNDKPYINRGISGQTTPQMLLRFRQDVIDLHPKVVLILAGTNDIAGNTGPMSLEQIMDNISIAILEEKVKSTSHIVLDVMDGQVIIRSAENEKEKVLFT